MILIFGGTTEGRIAAETVDVAGKQFIYSTLGAPEQVETANGRVISGALDADGIAGLCRHEGVNLIVDAAHPFAAALHTAAVAAATAAGIPVVRFERRYPPRADGVTWCDDWDDALRRLEADNPSRLLVLSGVNTIARLKPYWERHPATIFRILNRHSSRKKALSEGVDASRLIYYDSTIADGHLFDCLRPDAIITKESGESGGFQAKVNAALCRGIKVYAVCRPALPAYTATVTGRHGLRRAIETLYPDFYPLRSGFTTGACATAAARAALSALLTADTSAAAVSFTLPDGERMQMPVCDIKLLSAHSARASAVKDRSDDPDILRGATITATVTLTDGDHIEFAAGEGVGHVTLPGIGLPIGAPAINRGPRAMIITNLRELYPAGGILVTLSVAGGDQLARLTFNPRLGIEGGVSIIGTSGIVTPYSHTAFVEALRREMQVAVAMGARQLVLSSGAKSERRVHQLYPDLPPQAFIHYGNAVGDALRCAADLGVESVVIAVMPGKAVKLAAGQLDTHSAISTLDRDFLRQTAIEAGCDSSLTDAIAGLNMASELTALPAELTAPLWQAIHHRILAHLKPIHPNVTLRLLV